MTRKGFLARLLAPLVLPLVGREATNQPEAILEYTPATDNVQELIYSGDIQRGYIVPDSETRKYQEGVDRIVDEFYNLPEK